jgi:hypothetical protein
MRPGIYLETTIISYLAARPSRELLVAAHQTLTREWWDARRHKYELCVSQAVIEEAAIGDPEAAKRRLELLDGLRVLATTNDAVELARRIMREAKLPSRARLDALHVAIAATHGVPTLLTWNCRHIASATFRPRIESACRSASISPTVICTPNELMES